MKGSAESRKEQLAFSYLVDDCRPLGICSKVTQVTSNLVYTDPSSGYEGIRDGGAVHRR